MDEEKTEPEVSEKELSLTRDVIAAISKTLKTFHVYPKDNPVYQKFAEELFRKFNSFFESEEELSIDVEHHCLIYKGKVVFRSEERTDNISLLLFADGIRHLSFHKDITIDELIDFVEALRLAQRVERTEDDIVTLLWEKDIKNLSFSVVEEAVDDTLLADERMEGEAVTEGARGTTLYGASYSELTIKPVSLNLTVEPIDSDEITSLRTELSDINEDSLLSSAVELFFELLSSETDITNFSELIKSLSKIMNIRFQKNNLKSVTGILSRLKEISSVSSIPEQCELINNVITSSGNIEILRRLFKETVPLEDIRQYLLILDKSAVANLIEVLGELENRKERRFLCDVLIELGRSNINALTEHLKDERWYLVRNVILILGMIKDPATVKHIGGALKHPEAKVRREVVRAIEGIPSEETRRFLLMAIKDSDPTVRVSALQALRKFKSPGIFLTLKEGATREGLKGRSFSEKKELLKTLAILGGEEAFPLLSELFKKRGLIERDEITEIRASAAYGLGLIRTPEAISLLEKERNSKKSILREACLRAMRGEG